MTATGEVRALGATIGGVLNLQGARLCNEGKFALSLDRADVKGGARLDPVTVTGELRAVHATIGSELNLQGARLCNEGKDALTLDRADIKGDAFLQAVTVRGTVWALGATIGGSLAWRARGSPTQASLRCKRRGSASFG